MGWVPVEVEREWAISARRSRRNISTSCRLRSCIPGRVATACRCEVLESNCCILDTLSFDGASFRLPSILCGVAGRAGGRERESVCVSLCVLSSVHLTSELLLHFREHAPLVLRNPSAGRSGLLTQQATLLHRERPRGGRVGEDRGACEELEKRDDKQESGRERGTQATLASFSRRPWKHCGVFARLVTKAMITAIGGFPCFVPPGSSRAVPPSWCSGSRPVLAAQIGTGRRAVKRRATKPEHSTLAGGLRSRCSVTTVCVRTDSRLRNRAD